MNKPNYYVDIITLFIITIFGIIQGQVTVFYIIYLFWFQEFLRTVLDLIVSLLVCKTFAGRINVIRSYFATFMLLFIYFVFIVMAFGFMFNIGHSDILRQNVLVLVFRNWFFNLNLVLFVLEYVYFVNVKGSRVIENKIFNRQHVILHLSIILGAVMQMIVAPRLNMIETWRPALTVTPFLLLKLFADKPRRD